MYIRPPTPSVTYRSMFLCWKCSFSCFKTLRQSYLALAFFSRHLWQKHSACLEFRLELWKRPISVKKNNKKNNNKQTNQRMQMFSSAQTWCKQERQSKFFFSSSNHFLCPSQQFWFRNCIKVPLPFGLHIWPFFADKQSRKTLQIFQRHSVPTAQKLGDLRKDQTGPESSFQREKEMWPSNFPH